VPAVTAIATCRAPDAGLHAAAITAVAARARNRGVAAIAARTGGHIEGTTGVAARTAVAGIAGHGVAAVTTRATDLDAVATRVAARAARAGVAAHIPAIAAVTTRTAGGGPSTGATARTAIAARTGKHRMAAAATCAARSSDKGKAICGSARTAGTGIAE
jgi:hypothetical protein